LLQNHTTNIENKSKLRKYNEPSSSNIEILVLDENSEITTIDPKVLLNFKEWESPRQLTDPSTGRTVNLPFALKRLDKRN